MKRVYFIKPIGMEGPIKIGCSLWPDYRAHQLDTWSPFPLEVVAQIEGGEPLEMRFHNTFRASHVRKEWFAWTAELQAAIDAINAGTFDIESLAAPKRLPRIFIDRSHWKAA